MNSSLHFKHISTFKNTNTFRNVYHLELIRNSLAHNILGEMLNYSFDLSKIEIFNIENDAIGDEVINSINFAD